MELQHHIYCFVVSARFPHTVYYSYRISIHLSIPFHYIYIKEKELLFLISVQILPFQYEYTNKKNPINNMTPTYITHHIYTFIHITEKIVKG